MLCQAWTNDNILLHLSEDFSKSAGALDRFLNRPFH